MSEGVVLLVEDDVKLNNANRRALETQNYTVQTALALAKARELLQEIAPDIILLDVGLPDGDGFDFCAEIRGKTDAHILFLTANAEREDVFRGLSCGGDDYITKPFHARELLLRVQAAMRRRQISISQKTISKGSLTLNLVSGTAFADGNDLLLSQKEFSILRLLVENEGKNLQAEYLFGELWGQQTAYNNNTLRNHIHELRKKLDDGNCHYTIGAEYRKGYFLEQLKDT